MKERDDKTSVTKSFDEWERRGAEDDQRDER